MSYIAFDLDALNVSRDVGAAAGIPEERVTHGLLRMWAWCFREKTASVTAVHVRGFFGTDCGEALIAFGFLAREGDGFRVRGAERYLRISEARRRGAERTNAAKRKRATSAEGATVERRSSDAQATLDRALPDALTPNTEHRTPSTEHQKEEEAPPPKTLAIAAFALEGPDPKRMESWSAQEFWKAFELERRAAGYAPEKWPSPASMRDFWTEARGAYDVQVLGMTASNFFRDKHWQQSRPPCPWSAFAKQWHKYVPRKAVAS